MGVEVQTDGTAKITSYPFMVPAIAGSALSFLSLAYMPYGYYQFSRFAITAMAVWVISTCATRQLVWWSVAFTSIAVLYNPLIPIHLDREDWVIFNLAAGVLFIIVGCVVKDSTQISAHLSSY